MLLSYVGEQEIRIGVFSIFFIFEATCSHKVNVGADRPGDLKHRCLICVTEKI